ncbi:hypothetical protein [[Eubacterium] cellulosolvens]
MTIRIYVRGRLKVGSGVREPKFRVVAVTGSGADIRLKIEAIHFRKVEIEQIARDVDGEVIYLEPIPVDQRKRIKT